MNKKVYLVTVDTWVEGYGTCVELAGIYEDETEANKVAKDIEKQNEDYIVVIHDINLNKNYSIYIPYYNESPKEALILASYME